jgi:protein phosphatase
LVHTISERLGVSRFRGLDHGSEDAPTPVVILRMTLPPTAEPVPVEADSDAEPADENQVLPSFDTVRSFPTAIPSTIPYVGPAAWPSITWERALLETARHPTLPQVLDYCCEGGFEYLVEELPTGTLLWDAWDNPDSDAAQRFGWLRQIAECLQRLHQAGVLVEGLRPDIVIVTPTGQARLTDLSDLLPIPVPPDAPIRATPYTAPELMGNHPAQADARAGLYGFGAMLYALHLGRELTENDFDKKTRAPKPFLPFFPDAHPAFGRLITKTFSKEVGVRFPTDEAAREDPTGFTELIRTLDVCGRTVDNVRLEIAAWTTTGMIRTGNEDAFALLHAVESRQDDLGECALVLLADGMGGYEAGEVAAVLAIQALRKNLLQQKPFRMLAGGSSFTGLPGKDAEPPIPYDVEECKWLILAALRDANQQVHQAPRQGIGRRGMGCTAEVVFVDGRNVVVGHVGDSRTYHLHEGRLIQLTRDQTLVNRLVELGQLTSEEAEDHPRKNELQQAIGGQPIVEPGLYHNRLSPGDWVVVCSDGLSNHVKPAELLEMLQSEATSAETAARRLTNLVNLQGATDNSTVVVIRAT